MKQPKHKCLDFPTRDRWANFTQRVIKNSLNKINIQSFNSKQGLTMKNINTKLEKYAKSCDDIYLSSQLKKILKEAKKEIKAIKPNDLYTIAKDIILIDVREPEEFASGYINGHTVLTIPRGKLEFMAIEKIAQKYGQDAKIVTYCLKGPRGFLAAHQLKKLGFSNVSSLEGGILAWLKEGNTIHSYLGELSLA